VWIADPFRLHFRHKVLRSNDDGRESGALMTRREFITLVGTLMAACPIAARAQQPERMRRIGVLMASAVDDSESQARITGFLQSLQKLGWADGRNVRIDTRWAMTNPDDIRRHAAELVALAPDVILSATGTVTVGPLLAATRTVPIVFAQVIDPVGAGFVTSLARPGGNATGFTIFEYGMSGKWLELLKAMVPSVTRVAVLRDPAIASGIGQFAGVQALAPSLGVELTPVDVRDAGEIERAIMEFAGTPNGGLIVTSSALAARHRDRIIALAAKLRLPAVFSQRYLVTAGGLSSYGPDSIDQFRRAAGYVDRILKGEKPADLPVQAATKYELVINLKTAKTIGLAVPQSVLARADEVIE
jgi:putative tryptophan/tyrosine transport system substrate-binding protein